MLAIDWTHVISSASSWRTSALGGPALYVVSVLLRVDLAHTMRAFMLPARSFHRLQWQVVRETVAEASRSTRSGPWGICRQAPSIACRAESRAWLPGPL
jgi:hypothetical protein